MTAICHDRAWVATKKGLFELRQRGGSWGVDRISLLGEPVTMLLLPRAAGDSRMLASLTTGHCGTKLHASADADQGWHEVATPIYPTRSEGATGPAWKLVQLWSLGQARGTVWASTLPGGLFRTADYGRGWRLVDSLWQRPERLEWFGGGYDVPGVHSICPHPNRAGEIVVGISCGGAWTTRDDGLTWALSARGTKAQRHAAEDGRQPQHSGSTPHRPLRRRARHLLVPAPRRHLALDRQCRIVAGVEGAPVSGFGFAAAVHPHDADTTWFVPAEADQRRVPVQGALAVNRTRDGGRTWETLRDGLPQQHAYDLVYRHGLAATDDGPGAC
jgi:hypothetical protein